MQQVFDAVRLYAETRPDDVAFEDDTGQICWRHLAARVAGLAADLEPVQGSCAIGLAGGIDYVVADLAITLSGKRQVPLPFFFSAKQTAHVLRDAQVTAIITDTPALCRGLPNLHVIAPDVATLAPLGPYPGGSERIIYTSGSSGTPKGVVLGDRQLDASISALTRVIGADASDTHLSILPLAQLLEQICGIYLPIVAGARTVFRFEATKALFGGPIQPLVDAFEDLRPTTSLVAPGVLGRWVDALAAQGVRAPDSLRFVAVGGASTAPALIDQAWDVGIPVHEGYGLSECCAVVAMNRPGEMRPGTVGPVLDGLNVSLENGEIVVSGPTVMTGYLNGEAAPAIWHTGDLGHFDGDRLVIDGRKDALVITGAGRNISPEWVEQRVNADSRVVSSALGLRQTDGALVLVVVAAVPLPPDDIETCLSDLPIYARPTEFMMAHPTEPGLLFAAGTPNRTVAAVLIHTRSTQPLRLPAERFAS